MNYFKNFLVLFLLSIASISHTSDQSQFSYKAELEAFKKSEEYKTLFHEDTNENLKNIQRDIENYKNVSFLQRVARYKIMGMDILIITPATMPKLYAFIESICKKNDIKKIPTIFISTGKGFFNAFAFKLLTSSGAVVIGQKLIDEITDRELEAIVAHELGHIKHNHVNKMVLSNIISLIGTNIAANKLLGAATGNTPAELVSNKIVRTFCVIHVGLTLSQLIIGKRFEKQADEFAFKANDHGEGLKESFKTLDKKELQQDKDFDTTKAILKASKPKLSYYDQARLNIRYSWAKAGHIINKGFKWVYYNTPFGPHPSPTNRIKAIDIYKATQAQA